MLPADANRVNRSVLPWHEPSRNAENGARVATDTGDDGEPPSGHTEVIGPSPPARRRRGRRSDRQGVDGVGEDGVIVAGERIAGRTVIWTAGVAPSPAGKWLAVETDRAGRVKVQGDLTVPGHPEIFVIGDTASLEQDGKPLPGVAQVALQQGRYAGTLIHRRIVRKPAPRPFSYFDKGNMAVVGKGFAVLQTGRLRLSGFLAWLAWAAVHLEFVGQSSLRISVLLQWIWTYVTGRRGSRLIVNEYASAHNPPGVYEIRPPTMPRVSNVAQ